MNVNSSVRGTSAGAFVAHSGLPFGPRINFQAPDDLGGTGGSDSAGSDAAAAAAAEAARAAAAEVEAKAKAAVAEAEAARKAEAEKGGENSGRSEKEIELLREVMEKKAKLKEAETALAQREAELQKFNGINLDEVKALLEEKSQRERQEAEAKGEFERVKQMMAEEHRKKVEELQSQIEALKQAESQKNSVIDNLTIGNAFSTSELISKELTLSPTKARIVYGSHFEVVDGNVVGYDKPAGAANRTPLADQFGNPLPFEDALKRIIDADPERDNLFRAKLQPGAQSRNQEAPKPKEQEGELYGVSRILKAISK